MEYTSKVCGKIRSRRGATRKAHFFLNDTEAVDVDMMRREGEFYYGKFSNLDAQAIALPYTVIQWII